MKEHQYEDIVHEATYNTSGYIGQGCIVCGTPSDSVVITAPPLVDEILDYEGHMTNNTYVIKGLKKDVEELVIPESINGIDISEIKKQAFQYNTTLKKVTLPDTVRYIHAFAFDCCYNLEEINMPSALLEIGESGFRQTNLKEVKFNSGPSLKARAFQNCQNLRIVDAGKDTTSLSDEVFKDCRNLWSIKLSSRTTYNNVRGYNIFQGCTRLIEIIRPDGEYGSAFPYNVKYVRNNEDVNWNSFIKYEEGLGYVLNDEEGTVKLLLCEIYDDNLVLPELTKDGYKYELEAGCFYNITAKKITMRSVDPDGSFLGLYDNVACQVEEIVMDTDDYIPTNYFNGWTSSGLDNLKKITFTEKTNNFPQSGCLYYIDSLEEVVISSNGDFVFENVCYPKNSSTLKKVTITDGEKIAPYFFDNFNLLEEIIIKGEVKEIGQYAFESNKNSNYLNVTLPKSIEKIKDQNVLNWNVFYEGSEEEWSNVIVEINSSYMPNIYYYSENEKTDGNYWHYDENGNREIW